MGILLGHVIHFSHMPSLPQSNRFMGDEVEYMHIYYRDLNGAVIIYDMTELVSSLDIYHNNDGMVKN